MAEAPAAADLPSMLPPRRIGVIGAALVGALALPAPALAAGPILSGLGHPVSTLRLAGGARLDRYRLRVRGASSAQIVYKLSWKPGRRFSLDAEALGAYYPSDRSIHLGTISSWARWGAHGLVGAINGDFFDMSCSHGWCGRPSGLDVHDRYVRDFGWGGPAAGFLPGGNIVMGRPLAEPARLLLAHRSATVGAWSGRPSHGDQVGVYLRAGERVQVPSGYVAVRVDDGGAFDHLLRGQRAARGSAGAREPVAAFDFRDPAATATPTTSEVTVGALYTAGDDASPGAGALLLARSGSSVARDLAALSARSGSFRLTGDDRGWTQVDDVMGGKPQLVRSGRAVASRPAYVEDWQWGEHHWRPALVQGRDGRNWLAVTGGAGSYPWDDGVTAPTWAAMLRQMGARNAMGFDNNSSTELYRPGARPVTAYGYERSVALAVALSYR